MSCTREFNHTDCFAEVFGTGRGSGRFDSLAEAAKRGPVDVSAWRGCFGDIFEGGDTAGAGAQLEELLGLKLICLREAFNDEWERYSGWADLYVLDDDGALRRAPGRLQGILLDNSLGRGGPDFIDLATVERATRYDHTAGPLCGRYNHIIT
jgi:hypothetical protein